MNIKSTFLFLLIFIAFVISAKAQSGTWTAWVQVYPLNYDPTGNKVEISFKQNRNCLGYSYYRTRSDFSIENGNVSFYFDYLDCDGKLQSESITVLLDTPKVDYSATGTWYIGSRIVRQFRDVVPFIPQPVSANIGSTNGRSTGQSTADSAATNRNIANSLKPDLNLVINTFNSAYLTAYQKLPIIQNIQAERAYAAKLDSCKAQFTIYYKQAVYNYKNGNGDGLNTNLTSLKSTLSTMQTYVSMEGDVRLVYKTDTTLSNNSFRPNNAANINNGSQTVNTINSNTAGLNAQQRQTQKYINNAQNNSGDAIQQATALNLARIQARVHNGSTAQQQQQIQQIQQQQNTSNAQATSNLAGALGNLISTISSSNKQNTPPPPPAEDNNTTNTYVPPTTDTPNPPFNSYQYQPPPPAYLTLINTKAPDIDFAQNNGTFKLSDYAGKNILLIFWGSYNQKSVEEVKNATTDNTFLSTQRITIIGIANEYSRYQWTSAIESNNITGIEVSELNGIDNDSSAAYHVTDLPVIFLISSSGYILKVSSQYADIKNYLLSKKQFKHE